MKRRFSIFDIQWWLPVAAVGVLAACASAPTCVETQPGTVQAPVDAKVGVAVPIASPSNAGQSSASQPVTVSDSPGAEVETQTRQATGQTNQQGAFNIAWTEVAAGAGGTGLLALLGVGVWLRHLRKAAEAQLSDDQAHWEREKRDRADERLTWLAMSNRPACCRCPMELRPIVYGAPVEGRQDALTPTLSRGERETDRGEPMVVQTPPGYVPPSAAREAEEMREQAGERPR